MMAEEVNQKLLTSTPVQFEENSPENVTVTPSAALLPPQAAQLPVLLLSGGSGLTKITPHSFLIVSIIVAALCGVFNLATIICTIPAVFLSIWVSSFINIDKGGEPGEGLGNALCILYIYMYTSFSHRCISVCHFFTPILVGGGGGVAIICSSYDIIDMIK